MFERLYPTPVFVAPGNHDWYGPESLYHYIDWTSNVHVFKSDRLQPFTLTDGLTLWAAAHPKPSTTNGFLDEFRVDRSGIHLALFHGSERRLFPLQGYKKAMLAPFDADQIERVGLHYAFLGHYHQPQDADHYAYPGNPDPLTFGESGKRGAVIATCLPDGTVVRETRNVGVSEVHDIETDVTGCNSRQEILERLRQNVALLSGSVRVTLIGDVGTSVELRVGDIRREGLAPALDSLVPRVRLRPAYNLDVLTQEQTVRGQFVRDVIGSDLSDDERYRVLVTGLRAFDGRDDLEVF